MDHPPIRFDDGAAYEDFMGRWSRLAGEAFLDWLAPAPHRRWIDVGCGNGAFTELLVQRCAPAAVQGIDPAEAQLEYARGRGLGDHVAFVRGDATALPAADAAFDAAVMALVIFFVPEPARGVAEMARVVRPGGSVSAYAWDLPGGGFPYAVLQEEMAALGLPTIGPPSPEAARLDVLQSLWSEAGLEDVETCRYTVERSFDDFDAWRRIARQGPRIAPSLSGVSSDASDALWARVKARLAPGPAGRFTCRATAHAVRGRRR